MITLRPARDDEIFAEEEQFYRICFLSSPSLALITTKLMPVIYYYNI